jgi:hypothetical protein
MDRIKGFPGYVEMMLENPGNKYNRTLGKAFIDGRFNIFAVNPKIGAQTILPKQN